MPTWARSSVAFLLGELSYLWPSLLNVLGLGAIGLAGGAADDDGNVWLLVLDIDRRLLAWIGILALVVAWLALVRQSRWVDGLEKRLASAEGKRTAAEGAVQALSKAELFLLSEQLKYYSSERISLFVKTDVAFLLVARFSRSPAFNTQTGRIYPQNEGCLGTAWQVGFAEEHSLPDPKLDLDGWIREQGSRWGVLAERASAMTMRSRTYVAFRIDRSRGRDPLGVVIFESLEVPGSADAVLDRGLIEAAIKKAEGQRIRALLEQMAELA